MISDLTGQDSELDKNKYLRKSTNLEDLQKKDSNGVLYELAARKSMFK